MADSLFAPDPSTGGVDTAGLSFGVSTDLGSIGISSSSSPAAPTTGDTPAYPADAVAPMILPSPEEPTGLPDLTLKPVSLIPANAGHVILTLEQSGVGLDSAGGGDPRPSAQSILNGLYTTKDLFNPPQDVTSAVSSSAFDLSNLNQLWKTGGQILSTVVTAIGDVKKTVEGLRAPQQTPVKKTAPGAQLGSRNLIVLGAVLVVGFLIFRAGRG